MRAMQAAAAAASPPTLRGTVPSLHACARPKKTRLRRCQKAAATPAIGQRRRNGSRPTVTDRRSRPMGGGRCADTRTGDRRCQFARRINKCES